MPKIVIHQIVLSNLISLAKKWDIDDDELYLKIDADGTPTPMMGDDVEDGDEITNLMEINEIAGTAFPEEYPRDLVVSIWVTDTEGIMVDLVMRSGANQTDSRRVKWWHFDADNAKRVH